MKKLKLTLNMQNNYTMKKFKIKKTFNQKFKKFKNN